MKRKLVTTIGVSAIAICAFSVGVFAATDIKLFVNGKQSKTDIQIINDVSYVPLREVSEMLGAEVKWDDATRKISISNGKEPAANADPEPTFSYQTNASLTSWPMEMKINKVYMKENFQLYEYYTPIRALVMEVEVKNTSNKEIDFYPTMSSIVLNTGETAKCANIDSDFISGAFAPNAVKKARLSFEIKSDFSSISKFTYKTMGASVGSIQNSSPSTTVYLK
ncbi:copper amine oxidase N-terminal domain-containing protein [Paenibacillus sp. GbtcB18]|uniref:copper amine oxidase N-terminal domain-containing protein n=1 Tax=Paenibacillus sp. GbtcB18 TaxID=2824763 RepID=UPI001C2F3108|nr:copper amine oxidase N-terminal domain-containing protein [Paenibacillus sp. GbtcB18]